MAQAMGLPASDPTHAWRGQPAARSRTTGATWSRSCGCRSSTRRRPANGSPSSGWEDPAAARGTEGKGVLICAVHVGAMDMLAPAMMVEGEKLSAVGDDTTYGRLYDHLAAVRGAYGVDVIGWRNLRRLYKVLRDGGNLVLLCDGPYRPGDVPVEFLGAPTTLPAGPAILSARTGAAILPVGARRTAGDRLEAGLSGDPGHEHRAGRGLPGHAGPRRRPGPGHRRRSGPVVHVPSPSGHRPMPTAPARRPPSNGHARARTGRPLPDEATREP